MQLVKLDYKYKKQLEDMLKEWIEYNASFNTNHSPWAIFKNDYHDFEYYLNHLDFKESDIGHVPSTTLFLYDEERDIFVGASNIRHHLNYNLYIDGGHIGDGIRPSERNKGYGTLLIKLSLEKCKELGLKRVLMVCDKDNESSRKTIVNNGGVLENELEIDHEIEQRYWIELDDTNCLVGDKIVLRKAKMKDLDSMLKTVWSDERVYQTMWFQPTFDIEDGKQRLYRSVDFQSYCYGYFICLKDSDEAIGLCAIKEESKGVYEECGICIADSKQRLGYGKECLELLLDLAFNKLNGKEFIYALMKDNDKSRGLMNKFKFQYVRDSLETRPWDKKEFMLEYWKLSKEDYMEEKDEH